MRRPRAALLLAALACAVLASPPHSRARASGLDYKALKMALVEELPGQIQQELDKLDVQINDLSLPADARADYARAKQELLLFKKRVESDVGGADALVDSFKSAAQALQELDSATDAGYVGPIDKGVLVGKWWGRAIKASELAGTGADYFYKYKKLSEDLSSIDSALMSPGTKRMAQALTTLSHLMSGFGDKVPMFGSLLKAYGDLSVELTKATLALDTKIEAREQGQILPGVHGERGTMLDALGKLGIADAQRVDGTRDVFRGADGRLLIWDREARDWAVASDAEPGITEEEIIKRYLFFTSHGTKEPTPEQIIKGYHRAIVLELVPSTDHVAPGGTVQLTVKGRTATSDQPVAGKELYATVTMTSHTGIGEGELRAAERVRIGDAATWVAPNNLNETYTFSADLHEDTRKVALSGGLATALVRTGTESRLDLTADATEVPAGGPVVLTARLFAVDGTPIGSRAAGQIEVAAAPALGYFTDWEALADQKGTRSTWMAPDQVGTYVVTARYGGATGYSVFSDHTASAEATISITVGAPQADAGLDADDPGDAGEPDADDPDAAEVAATDADAAPIDWPGTWKGKMRTQGTMDGVAIDQTQDLTLTVERGPIGKILLSVPGQPKVELALTPSNPNAATATIVLPKPTVAVVPGTQHLTWDAKTTWTVFLAAGKLNVAMKMTIEQDVRVTVGDETRDQHSSMVMDSIGVLEKIK